MLVGLEARRMDNYVRLNCGVNSVPERDSEADSWHRRSVQANADVDAGLDDLAWNDVLMRKGEIGPDPKDSSSQGESVREPQINIPMSMRQRSDRPNRGRPVVHMADAPIEEPVVDANLRNIRENDNVVRVDAHANNNDLNQAPDDVVENDNGANEIAENQVNVDADGNDLANQRVAVQEAQEPVADEPESVEVEPDQISDELLRGSEPDAEVADDVDERENIEDEEIDSLLRGACDWKLKVRFEYRERIKQAAKVQPPAYFGASRQLLSKVSFKKKKVIFK